MGSNKKFIKKKHKGPSEPGECTPARRPLRVGFTPGGKAAACPFHPAHEELLKRPTCPAGEDARDRRPPRACWVESQHGRCERVPAPPAHAVSVSSLIWPVAASHRPASSDTCLDSAGPPGDTSWACRELCGRSPRTVCAQKQEDKGIRSSTELPCDAWRHAERGQR